MESPIYLGYQRRQRCRVGEEMEACNDRPDCAGPIDPHHVDGKGMGGARCRDDRTVPLCRKHHDGAHEHAGETATLLDAWADEALRRFLDRASPEEVRVYIRDLDRWKERPLWIAL